MLPTPVKTTHLPRYRHSALLRINAKPTVNACSQKLSNCAQDSKRRARHHRRCLSGMALAATLMSVNQRRLLVMRASSDFTSISPSLQPVRLLHLLDQALVDERQHRFGKGLPRLLILGATAGRPLLRQPALVDEVLEQLRIGAVADAQHVVVALLAGAVLIRIFGPVLGVAAEPTDLPPEIGKAARDRVRDLLVELHRQEGRH